VRAAWGSEDAEARLRLLKALQPELNEGDREFVEGIQKDRGTRVRALAERALYRLNGFTGEHAALAEILTRIQQTSEGFLRKHLVLKLDVPATLKGHAVNAWLSETFAEVSCDELARGLKLSVQEVIEGAAKDTNLMLALALMATADCRFDLLEPITKKLPEAWEMLALCGARSLEGTPEDEREKWAELLARPYGALPPVSFLAWRWMHRALRGHLPPGLMEAALDCIVAMDHEGRIVEFNPAAEKTFGYAREQALGRRVDELIVPPRLRGGAEAALDRALLRGEAGALRRRVERVAMRADGTEFPVEVSVTPIEGKGEPLYTAFLRDITERRQAEEALRGTRDELQKRVEARTAELKDANERLVDWVEELQQRAQDMRLLSEVGDHLQACHSVQEAYTVFAQYGGSLFPDEPGALCMLSEGNNLVECVAAWGTPPPAEEVFTPDDCWALRRGRPHVVEGPDARLVCRHVGTPPPAAYVCVPLMAQTTALGVLHLIEGPREAKAESALAPHHALARRQLAFTVADQVALALSNLRLQESLRDQAIRDPLTGLFNRRYMQESLDRELRRAKRRRTPMGVIMIDIDHFKRFNDTFGHEAGDLVLRELAGALGRTTRGSDVASRYGGEEFLVLLPECPFEAAMRRAERMREEVAKLELRYGDKPLGPVTVSLGVAVFPDHTKESEELLRCADEALYAAKQAGRNRVVAYSADPQKTSAPDSV